MNRFPQYLNEPLKIMWWEPDEVGIALLALMIALNFGGISYVLLACPWVYGKMKSKYPRGFFRHSSYALGLTKLEGYPIYFEELFVE